jgi:hypothetical protein
MAARTDPELAERDDTCSGSDRRGAERYPCCQECTVRLEQAAGVGSWPGILYNISTGGVGIALPYPLKAGAMLVIEGWEPTAGKRLVARVVRSVPVAYLFFYGCELAEQLDEKEMDRWVG